VTDCEGSAAPPLVLLGWCGILLAVVCAGRKNSTLSIRTLVITVLLCLTPVRGAIVLSDSAAIAGPAASSGTFSVTANEAWTAVSSDNWLTVTPSSGTGNQVVTYTYPANAGPGGRQATITVGPRSFTVMQISSSGATSAWGPLGAERIRWIGGETASGFGGDGGLATAATLNFPAIAVGPNGDVYLADRGNHRIRRIDAVTKMISTIAGTGTAGLANDDAPASTAPLSFPADIVFDAAGNLYISDSGNSRVLRLDKATGLLRVVAGTGVPGSSGDGGPGRSAQLSSPMGLALDRNENLYICDMGSLLVRRLDASTGNISTIAGSRTTGETGDGGLAVNAVLGFPYGIAVDDAGNIYFTDGRADVSKVRRIDGVSGVITTIAGAGGSGFSPDGVAAKTALLHEPRGVAVDAAGNVYIAESRNGRVRRVDARSGILTTVAGGGGSFVPWMDGGTATGAGFSDPHSVRMDATGNLFISDFFRVWFVELNSLAVSPGARGANVAAGAGSGSVAVVATPAQSYWTAASRVSWLTVSPVGSNVAGPLTYSYTANPAVEPRRGSVVVNGRSFEVVQAGAAASVFLEGTGQSVGAGSGTGTFRLTVVPAAGWSASSSAAWLTVSPTTGNGTQTITYSFSANPGTVGRMATITVAGKRYVVSQPAADGTRTPWRSGGYGMIRRIAGTGLAGLNGNGGPAASAQLNRPTALAVTANGDLLISDGGNSLVRRVSAETNLLTVAAGQNAFGYMGDGGPAVDARFNGLSGIVAAVDGGFIVADGGNHRVRRVDASGLIRTIGGSGSQSFGGDGELADVANVPNPSGTAIDGQGNLYVSTAFDHRIRRIDAVTGVITTIAGNGTNGAGGEGVPAAAASLGTPAGLALDGRGNLYVAERSNHRVRKIVLATGIITTVAGTGTAGVGAAELNQPWGVAVGPSGDLYIADTFNHRVRVLAAETGVLSTIAGTGVGGNSGDDGPGLAAQLFYPAGVSTDGAGNLYIADVENHVIRFLDLSTPTVTLSATGAGVPAAGGAGTVMVKGLPAGTNGWEVTGAPAWLTVTRSGNPVVRISTNVGHIDVTLLANAAPQTVENFLRYVSRGDYRNVLLHRLVRGFVLQGGGYTLAGTTFAPIPADPPVGNEFRISNTRGTLAMAKRSGDPNSATNEFFFNLADNATLLDTQNGGFTVFGQVRDSAGMGVMDQIGALPIVQVGFPPFGEMPLFNYQGGAPVAGNLVTISQVQVLGNEVSWTAAPYTGAAPRVATLAIGGKAYTVTQDGVGGQAPVLTAVTPGTASTVTQAFDITVRDGNGVGDINRIYFLVGANSTVAAGGCHGFFDRATNGIYLYDDALSQLSAPVTAGGSGSVQNSQCAINAGLSPVTSTSDSVTLRLHVTRQGGFSAGARNLYLWAVDNGGMGTGWVLGSSWNLLPVTPQPPVLVSATPSTVAALATVFSITARDANGVRDLNRIHFLINTTPAITTNACYGFYDRARDIVVVYDDQLGAPSLPIRPGFPGAAMNVRCRVNGSESSVSQTETELTLNLNLIRQNQYASGSLNFYVWVTDNADTGTGWVKVADWTDGATPVAPVLATVSPATATGVTESFTLTARDGNGANDINRIYFLVNSDTSIPVNTCHGFYDRNSNGLYLYDDALTGLSAKLVPGLGGSVQNSSCSLSSTGLQLNGTDLTLSLVITRRGSYATGTRNLSLWVTDNSGLGTGWQLGSAWTIGVSQQPPVLAGSQPATATGTSQTFTLTARDANGAGDVSRVYFLVNGDTTVPVNTCHGFYDRATNGLYLYNDALTGLLGPSAPGTGPVLQNTNCSVQLTSLSASGNDLTLGLALTRKGSYSTGTRNLYVWVTDVANTGTGWVLASGWTIAGGAQPPVVAVVTPGTATALTQTFTIVARDANGSSDISRVYFLVDAASSVTANSCHGFYDRVTNGFYLYDDALTTLSGPLVPGGGGTLQNSNCAISGAGSSVATTATDVVLGLTVTRRGGYVTGGKQLYLWATDAGGSGTGWVPGSVWAR
jgi:cyclophilin family peptidyl-prolyl cis-trans isomerase/sugar lactone lactonase YvrE